MTCHLQHFTTGGKRIGRRVDDASSAVVWEFCPETCPGTSDACTSQAPCDTCPAVCPYCRETWQVHIDPGNDCTTPRTEETA